nr:hypothetical protein [Microbacterium paludicola]
MTKTDAVRLVSGTLAARKSVYAEKQDPKFRGNSSTERGHRLEPIVQTWVEAEVGIPPANMLYAHDVFPLHAATPDSALEDEGEWSIVEIKTTREDWSKRIPQKIIDDVLWQAHVMGAGWAAVAWWQVDGEKGQEQPVTMSPTLVEIPIDPVRTQKLIDGVEGYLAWLDAGRPEHDDETDLPVDIVEAIEAVNAGKAAEKRIREWCERGGEEVNKTIPQGSIRFSVSESTAFDKAAFLDANPEAALVVLGADDLLKSAQKDPEYRKPTVRTSLTIAPPKEVEVAA